VHARGQRWRRRSPPMGLLHRRAGTARRRARSAQPRPACRTNSGSRRASHAGRPRCSASSIVRPSTNCWPSSRMARSTPRRNQAFAAAGDQAAERGPPGPPRLWVATSSPEIIRPQAAAFDEQRSACARCGRASRRRPACRRISASAVAVSGMRSSASARHISATPSWLEERELVHQRIDAAGRRAPLAQRTGPVAAPACCAALARAADRAGAAASSAATHCGSGARCKRPHRHAPPHLLPSGRCRR